MKAESIYSDFIRPISHLAETFLNIIQRIENGESDIDPTFPEKLFNKTPKGDVLEAINRLNSPDGLTSPDFEEYSRMIKTLADFVGNCNNTLLFRNFVTNKGREVCYINNKIHEDDCENIKRTHNYIRNVLRWMIPRPRIMKNIHNTNYACLNGLRDMVIKSDISAFFKSVRFEKVMKFAPKTFLVKNISAFSECKFEMEDTKKFERLEIALWGFLSCLFHNGTVPTGARYANELASYHLYNTIFHCFDKAMMGNSSSKVYVYVDDLVFTGREHDVKSVYAEFEKALNKGGLYLNYKKTQYFYPNEGIALFEYSALGQRKGRYDSLNFYSKVDSKSRKKCLDIIKERREYTPSEKGIINYAMRINYRNATLFNPDIIMHSYFNDKSELWDKLVAGELDLKFDKDIFDPTGLTYKDICVMTKNIPRDTLWPREKDDEDETLYAARNKFVEMFIGFNPSGYKIYCIDDYIAEERSNLSVGFIKESSNGQEKKVACVLSFESNFLDALYIDSNTTPNGNQEQLQDLGE